MERDLNLGERFTKDVVSVCGFTGFVSVDGSHSIRVLKYSEFQKYPDS